MTRAALLAAIVFFGTDRLSAQSSFSGSETVNSHANIERILDQKRDMVFHDATLSDVAGHLTTIGIPTAIDERALDDVGLGTDTPVNFHQYAIRTRDGLNLLTHGLDLTWGLYHGRLVITTPEGAEDELITKVYDVRNLVDLVPAPYWSGGMGGGRTITVYQYNFDSLIELITSTIEPDSWDEVGGAGAIRVCYTRRMRTLVVAQTYQAHQQIQALLSELAEHGGTKPLTSARVVVPLATPNGSAFQPPRRASRGIHASRLRSTARGGPFDEPAGLRPNSRLK